MQDRYGYDDVDLSDMPYADDDGIVHHPGMGDDPRATERAAARLGVRVRAERELDAPPAMAWSAIDDRTYDGDPSNPIGRGPTEADAIRDLLDKIEDREDEAAGDDATQECPCCGGDGVSFVMATLGGDPDDGQAVECQYCNGTGRIPRETV